ncbi:RNA-binding protein [Oleiphilus messinensis]|uniref:RNA-binding protein n=1 Tax=Oleiphilus messinensis TaxID=141451 RepID=A0A1Y0I707_9GAMM|nr:ribosome assembly RNA-binding protein YhbY [Oleiphilus messinensis]ARU55566.1 RNA-binding protein [Oleiphilus messinensis]
MPLSNEQKRQYKAIAHNLNPIVIIGDKGLSEGLLAEVDRALNDHELIKIKINIGEKEDRQVIVDELVSSSQSELVQIIGKMAIIVRRNPKPNPKLSNILKAAQ